MIDRHHREAYFKGLDDANAGIPARLEICQDPKEYEYYFLGRKAAKNSANVSNVKITNSEPIEPILVNVYTESKK